MDYLLDKKIKYKSESEFKSLYTWSLSEESKTGTFDSNDIPWPWSFHFTVSSLTVSRGFTVTGAEGESVGWDGKPTPAKGIEIDDRIVIGGDLYSGGGWRDEDFIHATRFSMFGTDRIIRKFDLRILPTDNDSVHCSLWGCPSYNYEIDFRNDVTEDTVVVNIFLNKDRFNEFVRLIESKQVDMASVRLSRVSGFYSAWSPDISTSYVKVLTRDQVIEGLEGHDFEPPKLGEVGECEITFQSIQNLKAKRDQVDFYKQFDEYEADSMAESQPMTGSDLYQQKTHENFGKEQQMVFFTKLINGIKLPLWLIFLALVLSSQS